MTSHHTSFAAMLAACLGLAVAFLPSPAQAGPPSPRQRTLMDAGWRFQLAAGSSAGDGIAVTDWRWKSDDGGQADEAIASAPALDTAGDGWQAAHTGDDVFHGRIGFAWVVTPLPDAPGPHRTLHFEGVDDNATVYLNGTRLKHHEGWDDAFDVPLDSAWKAGGPNVAAVLVENTAGAGGITGAVSLVSGASETSVAPEARPDFWDSAWRVVHLPHDYVVEQKFSPGADTGHGSLPTPQAWYRKTFTLPKSDQGRSVWIDFDGVYRDAKVYLNGELLGEEPSGYTAFRYDISKAAHYGGANVLAVHVDPRHFEGWWYEGGGIYRHVWLNVADPIHIAPWGVYASAQLPEPVPGGSIAPATVTIKTTLANAGDGNADVTLTSQVRDDQGKAVGTASLPVTLTAGQSAEQSQQIVVPAPRLWSLETPRLYHVVTQVQRNGKTIDTLDTPFGIRTIRFDAEKGFFLNGKRVEIQGVCNHQDFAGVGVGVPDSLEYYRVKRLKEIGCNAWRTSHNPPNAEVLDACDKLGMLVMDENRHLGDTESAKTSAGTPATDLSELTAMVLRDRNHPSIIMWSMCNEEPLQSTEEGARIFTAMKDRVHQYDTTRPITCAMNDGGYHGIALVEDLRGFNYGPGVYTPYHKAHPDIPLYGSEIGSTTQTRGIYADDRTAGYVTSYDTFAPPWAQTAEDTWTPIATQPFVAGGYVWTGFDYKGEPTPYGWPCINSHFGLLDMCGFAKDDAFYYQAYWRPEPMVHLLPHWNWAGKEGQPIPVWAYSNGDSVELFLNGRSLGRKDLTPYRHVEWSVPYAPGTLEARAYRDGRLIATDKVETTGAPAALRLSTDSPTLAADGEAVAPVVVEVVDAQGRVVPDADSPITFQVTGAGHNAGVGNGDPSDHDPDQAPTRRAFNGKAMVLVGANDHPGAITLTASSPGLKGAALRLRGN
jgi:beta-galactosidase